MKHIKLFEDFINEAVDMNEVANPDMSKFKAGQKIKWSSPKGPKEDEIEKVDGIYLKLKSGGTIPYQSVITEALNPKEFEAAVKNLAHSMPNHTSYEDMPSDEQIMKAMQKYQKDLYKHSTSSQKKDAVEMVKQILSESNTDEAYKQVPYNVKISGVYKVDIDDAECTVRVAGFERQSDDYDALYLMDSDPYKSLLGSLIVKNKDMFSLPKGKTIKAHSTTNNNVTITRLRDL